MSEGVLQPLAFSRRELLELCAEARRNPDLRVPRVVDELVANLNREVPQVGLDAPNSVAALFDLPRPFGDAITAECRRGLREVAVEASHLFGARDARELTPHRGLHGAAKLLEEATRVALQHAPSQLRLRVSEFGSFGRSQVPLDLSEALRPGAEFGALRRGSLVVRANPAPEFLGLALRESAESFEQSGAPLRRKGPNLLGEATELSLSIGGQRVPSLPL